MKRHFIGFIRTFSVLAVIALIEMGAVSANSKLVRVAIVHEVDHCVVAVDGRYTLLDYNTGERLDTRPRLKPSLVVIQDGLLRIGDKVLDRPRLILQPRQDASLRVNNTSYRGTLVIINGGKDGITVVNSIELEQYIRGVLYHEISDKWPMEAIKTQAVATRTFALYSVEQYAARDYDVTDDVYSQVYGGKSAERYRTTLAVRQTAGQVLTYRGKIFPAFFHSNSGGVTESAKELWNVDIPPLRGGVESPYSVNSPHYRWQHLFRLKDIQDKLNARGYKIGLIKDIRIKEKNASGRVRQLQLTDRDGTLVMVDGKSFREILGFDQLRSNLYDLKMRGYYVDITGHGWGHGVGLCQWGAYNMARVHATYKEILAYYYPGAEIQHLQDID